MNYGLALFFSTLLCVTKKEIPVWLLVPLSFWTLNVGQKCFTAYTNAEAGVMQNAKKIKANLELDSKRND